MNAETSLLVEAFPGEREVAILRLPAGAVGRVHHPSGLVRDYIGRLDIEAFAVVPGDRDAIGWGVAQSWYYDVRGIRNGHRALDRPAWHDAARLLADVPVVYVAYEQVEYFGKQRWTAVEAGIEPLGTSRLTEKAGAA